MGSNFEVRKSTLRLTNHTSRRRTPVSHLMAVTATPEPILSVRSPRHHLCGIRYGSFQVDVVHSGAGDSRHFRFIMCRPLPTVRWSWMRVRAVPTKYSRAVSNRHLALCDSARETALALALPRTLPEARSNMSGEEPVNPKRRCWSGVETEWGDAGYHNERVTRCATCASDADDGIQSTFWVPSSAWYTAVGLGILAVMLWQTATKSYGGYTRTNVGFKGKR